jgi:deoxycytidine triphosphate deaminase
MILTGDALREKAEEVLDPAPPESAYGPCSVDVHIPDAGRVVIESGEHWVTPARESVEMPLDTAALLTGRSSHMRDGMFMPAGWLDPGFASTPESPLKLEFGNTSDGAGVLEPGEAAGRLTFFGLATETGGYDGRWQG